MNQGIKKRTNQKLILSKMEVEKEIDELDYANKVFALLIYEMKDGDVFMINQKVHPDNRVKFIETVKLFIECDYGRHLGGYYIEFSNDYSKIKKFNYF